jgi:hypothetical protein
VTLTPDRTPPVAAEDFAAQINSAVCQLWVRCGVYDQLSACEATDPANGSWKAAQRLYDISQDTVQYEGSRAADCIARIASATCSDNRLTPYAATVGILLADCDLFVLGKVPEGGACNHEEECGANSTCNPDPDGPSSGCLAGTCARFDNRTCGTGTPPCPNNEACLPGGVCGGAGRAGDHCELDHDCGKGLVCRGNVDASGPTGAGMCTAAPNTGDFCEGYDCPLGDSCIMTSFTALGYHCLANVGLGQACSAVGEISSLGACKQDLVCDLPTHTCMAAQPGTVGGEQLCR